jgi:homocysteine S-methyltransferase
MVSSRYSSVIDRLSNGETILLDGATGSELEDRGVQMDNTWCGTASLEKEILKQIHKDYIMAGSQIITTNTYASSRMLLESGGVGDRFEEINLSAINAAKNARNETDRDDVLIAGSLSHQVAYEDAFETQQDKEKYRLKLTSDYFKKTFDEMALFLSENGCDFILLELMYRPDRMEIIFESAKKTNLPVWAGFSARKGQTQSLSLTDDYELSFKDLIKIIDNYDLDAVGIMHCDLDVVEDCIKELRQAFDGPIMVYPEVAVFKFPHYDLSKVISPSDFLEEAKKWKNLGAQIIGGCCGTSVEHIKVLEDL